MTQTAPGPIVVAEFITYCDRADHEVTVLCDGLRVTASAHGQAFTSPVYRDESRFTVLCDVLDRHDVRCEGSVTVDTADHGSWRPATPADHTSLTIEGQQVTQ